MGGAFFTQAGRLALGLMTGQEDGLGIGELGDSTAEGEPNSAVDCGSAIGVAAGSGATVTVVLSLDAPGMAWLSG
ncbi:MAG TPA: hypothetical protein VIC25_03485 [Caulobacteraceae bacterium]